MPPETAELSEEWQRAGTALIAAMTEVAAEVAEEQRPLLFETAAYWLAIGLAAGVERPADAQRLFDTLEPAGSEREELLADARAFLEEALA